MDIRLSMNMCKRVVNTDVSEDIILPDYYPEIRRVLCVRENLLPPAKFVSGNKIDINGVVDYTLIYVSNEGKLCSAPLSAEYSFSLPLENASEFELSEGVNIMAHSVADSSTVRVSAPRKLQVRSRIRSSVSAWGKMSCCEKTEGIEDPSTIERLSAQATCAEMLCESSDIVSVEDEYRLPSEDCRVAVADGTVVIQNSRIEGEMIRINGEAVIRMLLMCDGETRAERVVRRIPFEAETDLDGIEAAETSLLRVGGSVTELALNVEEGSVYTQADIVLEICLGQNRDVSYTADAYSTRQASSTEMRTYPLPLVLENRNASFSQSDRIELSELNFNEGAEIVDIYGSAVADEAVLEDGKYVIRGNCKYNMICLKDGEYSHCEARAPFKYELDGEREVDCFDSTVDMLNCKVRNDGEFLNLDSELALACSLMGSVDTEMLDSVSFYDELDNMGGEWTVCYVRDRESAWNIAKRYGVRESDIKGDPASDRYVIIER